MENNAGMQLSPSCQPEPNTVWFGLALLYYDTRFPRFSRLLPQHDIWRFSTDYLFKFAGRFFSWRFIVASAVFLVYRWLAKRVLNCRYRNAAAVSYGRIKQTLRQRSKTPH